VGVDVGVIVRATRGQLDVLMTVRFGDRSHVSWPGPERGANITDYALGPSFFYGRK